MFLDTSGLLCFYYATEPLHSQAVAAYTKAQTRFTHNYVLAEFIALATARRFPRLAAIEFIEDLLDNPDIKTVWVDKALHRRAIALLLERPDKGYSLCDAVSFLLMRQHNISAVLTTDKHFVQEGFLRLLG